MPNFRLVDIVESAKSRTISLPTVQRGFVWKPYQIENLWDSLLRGYPVGSFVLSRKADSADAYELLDGQQRASAICLGFHNPMGQENDPAGATEKFFRTSTANILVFIDLARPNAEYDNRKYVFRVITRSHPWGYRRQENQKPLESDNIAKAMQHYGIKNHDYLKKPLDTFWPYDACQPVPLGIFVDSATKNTPIEVVERTIAKWREGKSLGVIKRHKDEKISLCSVQDIYSAVQKMLETQEIPGLILDVDKIYKPDSDTAASETKPEETGGELTGQGDDAASGDDQEDTSQPNTEDRSVDEVENLFIRLNSGGTPLRGEELNYSVLKANISAELQTKIEDCCKGLFSPARFITIAFRLFNLSKLKTADKDSITMKVKPKQFQRRIKENIGGFAGYLQETFLNADVLRQFRKLLSFDKDTNASGLPAFIVATLAERAPEIVFMLLYRISVKKDVIDDGLKRRMLGMVTLFLWLGKGEKQKDYGKLLTSIWPCVRDLDGDAFWSIETIQRAMVRDHNGYEVLTPFPSMGKLQRLVDYDLDIRSLTWQKLTDSDYGNFIAVAFYNKDLILYAQRAALHGWFHEIDGYDLDDTNRAFDWDHICPASAVHRKRNIQSALRDWYSSNGNFRAWPYSLNRKDQDAAPADKLQCQSEEEVQWWTDFCGCRTQKEVNDYLRRSSFCASDWLEISKEDLESKITENGTAKQLVHTILRRNIELCKEWYKELAIDTLQCDRPSSKSLREHFLSQLDARMWNESYRLDYDKDRYEHCMSLGKDNLYLYVSLNTEAYTLRENNIQFGVWAYDSVKGESVPLRVKVPKALDGSYVFEKYMVYGRFTLLSFSASSLSRVLKDFYSWLGKFPDKDIRGLATQKFADSIRKEYRDGIVG